MICRYILKNADDYKGVLTVSIYGINRRMLGLKLSFFFIDECIERTKILNTTQVDWDLREPDKINKIKVSLQNYPFGDYLLV